MTPSAPSPDRGQFDLIVIGAGPAGEKGAAQAAYFGKRVCIVERAPKPGGAAVNTGAIPSKTLRETALYFAGFRQRGLYGVDLRVKPDITIGDFMQRERSVIETEWERIDENLDRHHIATVQGAAHFVDARTIEVVRYGQEPKHLTADVFLVSTGARPKPPHGFTLHDDVIVDSDTLLTIQKIPSSMIVVGGGVIGCEYACMFAALGVRVTLINERGRLLSHLDPDVSDVLRQSMTARLNVTVYGNAEIRDVEVDGKRAQVTLSEGTHIAADLVLVASGRCGNSAGLGLEKLGVRTNAQSFVQVDANYRTAVPHIYAAGDVIGFPALASAAMEQARVAVCHAFDLRYKRAVSSVLPYGVWTVPEIATVGESEESLLARGVAYETGRASFRYNARGQILGDLDGFVKLLFEPATQRVLGVTIVGEGACELIHVGMTVIALEGTLDFFIQAAFGFPSLSDAYKYAAYDGLQQLQRRHARMPGLPSVATSATDG
ncbi:MAG TPA: Si-specific NAD(P)(+) transhydrogenase [Gemmatimonadaceae bacterium]|nr:Si-specific NAD(P)(+) transhydrogenase [Gemmatimonadaceae bacterium]